MLDLDPIADTLVSRHLMAVCFVFAMIAALAAKQFFLSLLMGYGTVESYALWRFDFHNWVEGIMEAAFPGRSHFEMQTWFILLGSIPGLIGLYLFLRSMITGSAGQRIQGTGIVALLFIVAVELVSRDDIIRLFYAKAGPLTIFTWWVCISTLFIAVGCIKLRRDSKN